MSQNFNDLLEKTGVSTRGASYLFDVRYDTVRNWKYGRSNVPVTVIEQMKDYAAAADKIFNTEKEK